jgi:flagellar biosynthesis chaperone FliJ
MAVETETLKQFRDKVDTMLKELDSGEASSRRIRDQVLHGAHLGRGFSQAEDLTMAYHVMHMKLEELSKTLSDQIEAMTITVDLARNGYQGTEDDQVSALWKIHDRTEKEYRAAHHAKDPGGTVSPQALTAPGPPSAPASAPPAPANPGSREAGR